MRTAAIAAAVFAAAAGPATAATDSAWPEIARDTAAGCTLAVTGDGRFFRIAASGLTPGATARFTLTNGDMRPLDWIVRADAAGAFARYYLPFRWHRGGGVVSVEVTGAGCAVSADFAWRRSPPVVG